ncbi:Cation diffusion facilitator CzcD-associated flavoprotein CzcO OS=Streptomyces violarus OX=67380 GN=FHS41_004504 PE=3 SV=1 [Streptomyces violarus]
MADGWTSTARLQQKLIPTDGFTGLTPEERERLEEIADFQKMNELRARVDAIVEDPATAEKLKPWYRYMCNGVAPPSASSLTTRPETASTCGLIRHASWTAADRARRGPARRRSTPASVRRGSSTAVDCGSPAGTGSRGSSVVGPLNCVPPAEPPDARAGDRRRTLDAWRSGAPPARPLRAGFRSASSSPDLDHARLECTRRTLRGAVSGGGPGAGRAAHVAEAIGEDPRARGRCAEDEAAALVDGRGIARRRRRTVYKCSVSQAPPASYNPGDARRDAGIGHRRRPDSRLSGGAGPALSDGCPTSDRGRRARTAAPVQ